MMQLSDMVREAAVGTGIELYDFGGGMKQLVISARPVAALYQFPSTRRILFFSPREAPEQLKGQIGGLLKVFDELSVKVPEFVPGEEPEPFDHDSVMKRQLEELDKRGLN